MKHPALVAALLVLALAESWADENDTASLKQHQQQLQELLLELDQAGKQRSQHHAALDRLERQLECNWRLIQSYEVCKKLHDTVPMEYRHCTTTAKQNAVKCTR
jgi:septal ring factor EnvC (AmiA/AmiB activator)